MIQPESDVADFTAYFQARADLVRRSAYVLCGDWHAADDLAQEAFLRLAASWDKIRDSRATDAYVRTCLVRSFLREKRRAWRRNEQIVAVLPEQASDSGEQAHVARIAVRQALQSLPPRQRAVLVCRYLWDMDVDTTAQVLRCSTGTVKSQTLSAGAAAMVGYVAANVPPGGKPSPASSASVPASVPATGSQSPSVSVPVTINPSGAMILAQPGTAGVSSALDCPKTTLAVTQSLVEQGFWQKPVVSCQADRVLVRLDILSSPFSSR